MSLVRPAFDETTASLASTLVGGVATGKWPAACRLAERCPRGGLVHPWGRV